MIRVACISLIALAGCGDPASVQRAERPDYVGVDTRLLDGDLVQFEVAISGSALPDQLDGYADCAAAQYALIRGYGFARHVRTNLKQSGDMSTADAVYMISPSLPRGLRTIDAEVVVANCKANAIPTV